ncbi:MAG: response regulator [Candidatus Manganitrophaceae bacterium]|nr:MAG: response regulator [Candidatus Manganitrophaceae bacterium]
MKMERPRILVLDDDKTFRELLVDLLTGAGYEAVSVVTGEDALCKIQEERFDLATIDFDLPGWVNGIDFLKELKEMAPHTEVILLTGNASEEVAKEAILRGAFHYYLKPLYHIDQFLTLVGQALESSRQKKKSRENPKAHPPAPPS